MRVWRCIFYDDTQGAMLSWHGTKSEATDELLRLQNKRGHKASGPEGVSKELIPADKTGLLRWLNMNFTTDNG